MNWKNSLVAVFSPTTESESSGVYGTAFPVGSDLIITARHVVVPPDADFERPIKLRWEYGGEGWTNYSGRDELVVWSSKELDVALLRVSRPTKVTENCLLSPQKPQNNQQWQSEAYPNAARIEDALRPSSVTGKVMTKADDEDYFQVTVDAGLITRDQEDWGGASGMPIVVNGYVIGVAVNVEAIFAGTIQVAPVWKFWDQIKQHILPSDSAAEFEIATKGMVEEFVQIKLARSIVFKNVPEFRDLLLGSNDDLDSAQATRNILSSKPRELFLALYFAIQALKSQLGAVSRNEESTQTACKNGLKSLRNLANQIAPFVLAVSTGRAAIAEGFGIREVPVVTQTMAELVRAAVERRRADFIPKATEEDSPRGKAQVPLAVEFDGEELLVTMIADNFFHEFVGENNLEEEDVSLLKSTTSLVAAKLRPKKQTYKLLNIALEGKIARRQALPFLAVEAPSQPSQRAALIAELEKVHKELPLLPIVLLESEDNDDVLENETRELDHFITLLPTVNEVDA